MCGASWACGDEDREAAAAYGAVRARVAGRYSDTSTTPGPRSRPEQGANHRRMSFCIFLWVMLHPLKMWHENVL
jgi:hypothetical protein